MNKVKIFTVTLALMAIFGAAQVEAQGLRGLIRNAVTPKQEQPAGITPEAVIGQAPDLPSVATLASGGDLAAFYEQIATLREKMRETTDRVSANAAESVTSDAERIARQQTGRSVAELQNMSEAEQQAMAQQMVQRQLAAAGMGNMSLEQLKALEGKSDEEIMAAMTAGGMTVGGLTPAELQAMEKMTDAQKAAYMQQGDRMQRMQAAAPTAQQSRNVTAQSRNAQAQAGVVAEMKRITDRWAEIDRLNAEQTQDVAAKCAEITARYAPQIAAVPRFDKQKDGDYYTESEQRAVSRLSIAEFSEKFTLWRNLVGTMQGRIKTKMANVTSYDELSAQSMASGGVTAIPYMGYQIASDYLDLTESVTILPEVTQSQPNIN